MARSVEIEDGVWVDEDGVGYGIGLTGKLLERLGVGARQLGHWSGAIVAIPAGEKVEGAVDKQELYWRRQAEKLERELAAARAERAMGEGRVVTLGEREDIHINSLDGPETVLLVGPCRLTITRLPDKPKPAKVRRAKRVLYWVESHGEYWACSGCGGHGGEKKDPMPKQCVYCHAELIGDVDVTQLGELSGLEPCDLPECAREEQADAG